MRNNRRLIYLFTPLAIWLLSQSFLLFPRFFYSALLIGLLLIMVSAIWLARLDRRKYWPALAIPPALFFASFSLYATLIPDRWPDEIWIELVFLLEAWFVFSYFRNLYYYLAYDAPERREKLDSLLVSGGFLATFALGASFYGLSAFIDWSLAAFLSALTPLVFLLFSQLIPFRGTSLKNERVFLIVNTLMLVEIAGMISLLPLNYNILGFIFALAYSFELLAWRLDRRGELDRRRLKFPLVISIIIVIILFLTASWL